MLIMRQLCNIVISTLFCWTVYGASPAYPVKILSLIHILYRSQHQFETD